MSILHLIATSNFITVNRTIAEIVGLEAAVVFGELASEAAYWQEHDPEYDGSFYSTIENLEKRTCLSAHSQRMALSKLQEQGWVTVEKRGMPAKRYIRIHEQQVAQFFNDKTFKILTTSDEKNERQDVQNFNGNKNINKENIKEDISKGIAAPADLQNKSEDHINKALDYLVGCFPYLKGKIQQETRDAWREEFIDTDPEIFMKAIKDHVSTCRYFPTPAEINEQIRRAYLTVETRPSSQHQNEKDPNGSEEEQDYKKVEDILSQFE